MSKPHSLSLHIFRRDLRLHDNTALLEALKSSEQVLPCFIFDKRQIELNDYKSNHCIEFMANSLQELANELKETGAQLYFFYGIAEEIIEKILSRIKIDAIYINRDYTPFSIERDKKIARLCQKNKIEFHCFADALLHEPEQVLKPNHEPYTVFTHFYKQAQHCAVKPPQKNLYKNYYTQAISFADKQTLPKLLKQHNPNLLVHGGRREGLSFIKKIKELSHYQETRNFPALNGTSKLSAHNKFGTVSVREVYAEIVKDFGRTHPLMTELHWRDFFTHIGFHFPHVFGQPFHQRYANLNWSRNTNHFRAWCEGRTGFPIVDAGMRELNTTGYMHNRVRMIVASFLTKDLHIDWRWGEKYFAQKLVDYDPAVNNGNWQWAASTGCDAQPYFRIFNPWLQQQKFDPECLYIKQWVPELTMLPPKIIHNLAESASMPLTNYPCPMLDHAQESKKAKMRYQLPNAKK